MRSHDDEIMVMSNGFRYFIKTSVPTSVKLIFETTPACKLTHVLRLPCKTVWTVIAYPRYVSPDKQFRGKKVEDVPVCHEQTRRCPALASV